MENTQTLERLLLNAKALSKKDEREMSADYFIIAFFEAYEKAVYGERLIKMDSEEILSAMDVLEKYDFDAVEAGMGMRDFVSAYDYDSSNDELTYEKVLTAAMAIALKKHSVIIDTASMVEAVLFIGTEAFKKEVTRFLVTDNEVECDDELCESTSDSLDELLFEIESLLET